MSDNEQKILADECVDYRIINKLRENDIFVQSVLEKRKIFDSEVLEMSNDSDITFVTEDYDFGKWILSQNKGKFSGVIILQYEPNNYENITDSLIKSIKNNNKEDFLVIK